MGSVKDIEGNHVGNFVLNHIRSISDESFGDTIYHLERKPNPILKKGEQKKNPKGSAKRTREISSDEQSSEDEQKSYDLPPEKKTKSLRRPKKKKRKKKDELRDKINTAYVNKKYGLKNIFNRNYESENLNYFERCVKKANCTECQNKFDKQIPGCGRDILLNTVLHKKIQAGIGNPKKTSISNDEKKENDKKRKKKRSKGNSNSKQENDSENEHVSEEYACGDCVLFWEFNNWQPKHGGLKISAIDGNMIEVSTRDDITYGRFDESNIVFYPFGNLCNVVAESRLVIDQSNKFNNNAVSKWNGRHLCPGHARKFVPPGRKAIETEGSKILNGKFVMFDVDAFPFFSSQSMTGLVSRKKKIPPGISEMMKDLKGHIIHQFRWGEELPETIKTGGTAGMEYSESEADSSPEKEQEVESDGGDKRMKDIATEVINTDSDAEINEDDDLDHSSNESFIDRS